MVSKDYVKVTGTPTYNSWRGMKDRCLNANDPRYKDYGGRGITVCERWLTYANFLEDMGKRPEGKTLDRIDNGKGYCKDNCKWSTRKQQQRNMRTNSLMTYCGRTQSRSAWCEELGLNHEVVRHHKRQGKTDREAIQWAIRYALKAVA